MFFFWNFQVNFGLDVFGLS